MLLTGALLAFGYGGDARFPKCYASKSAGIAIGSCGVFLSLAKYYFHLCHRATILGKSAATACGDDRARALRLESLQGLSPSTVMSCLLNLMAMMKDR